MRFMVVAATAGGGEVGWLGGVDGVDGCVIGDNEHHSSEITFKKKSTETRTPYDMSDMQIICAQSDQKTCTT